MFKKIGFDNIIEHARRFRNTAPDKIPPIFVKLKPNIDRYRVVSAARALRKMNDFKGVYINLDRTEAEREFDRNLRESQRLLNRLEEDVTEDGRHRKWFIKRGRVVRGADSVQGVSNRADSVQGVFNMADSAQGMSNRADSTQRVSNKADSAHVISNHQ